MQDNSSKDLVTIPLQPSLSSQMEYFLGDLLSLLNLFESVAVYFLIPSLGFINIFWISFAVGVLPGIIQLISIPWFRTFLLIILELTQLVIYVVSSLPPSPESLVPVIVFTLVEITILLVSWYLSERQEARPLLFILFSILKTLSYSLMNSMSIFIIYLDPETLFNTPPCQIYILFILFSSSYILEGYFGHLYDVASSSTSGMEKVIELRARTDRDSQDMVDLFGVRNLYFIKVWKTTVRIICIGLGGSCLVVYFVLAIIDVQQGFTGFTHGFLIYLIVIYSILDLYIVGDLLWKLGKWCLQKR
jgi:hypothetical protein